TVNYIAKWNGSSWSHVGTGISGAPQGDAPNVFALAASGSGDVYAGGFFGIAGGIPAANIAKWDGSSSSALGSGVDDIGAALAVLGSDLYAGGSFSMAGGKVSQSIARAYVLPLPTLSVRPSGIPQGGITISWPSADTADFMLQQTGIPLPPASWVSNTASI